MEFIIKIGTENISLLGSIKQFKIGKLEIIQKWWIKNDQKLKLLTTKSPGYAGLKKIQDKLESDMEIIKASSINEGQGKIWDTQEYNNYKRNNIVITTGIEKDWETLNNIDREVFHQYIETYFKHQPTDALLSFLEPVVADRFCAIVELPEPLGD